ncbi:MAG: signal peptide peptidase SppA [Bacteroidales bacterium]
MKQFFKFMFASMLGFFLTSLLLIFFLFGMIASLGKKEQVKVEPNTVLHLTLTTEIIDRASDNPFESFDFISGTPSRAIGLNDLLRNIRKAKETENIKGIFLDVTAVQAGWASLREIREALEDFKTSEKFILAYSDVMTQGAYYLATVADEILINPEGGVDFRGLNAEVMFLKRMLEKIGVDAQVIRHGKFKSAGEPFFLEKLSAENRIQIEAYVGSLWNTTLKDIADSRNMTINRLNEIADGFITRTPQGALEAGMIDGIAYRDEVMDNLRNRLGLEENKKVSLITYSRFQNAPLPESMLPMRARDKVAVIYGQGNIIMGEGGDRSMGADRIAAALRKAREDESVKAIVFRINSGGGSALASEIMLREAMLAAEAKPLIVSMGDVAASGGYYVAAYADKIIANPNTITGSIGVFGMIPNMKELFNDKLGITFDNVKTNQLADLASVNRPLNRLEREIIQSEIERVYDTFLHHVSEGRNLPLAAVDSIAQGRVWSGVDAKRIGLIDEFGGLQFAIAQAAEMAELETYRVVEYPVQKDFFTRLREGFSEVETRIIRKRLGESYRIYESMQQATENTGILMRMPFDMDIQ